MSSGFKGGEVTPLFFIGAALGNTLAWLLGAPVDLFAALGFVAVFAGATNTPLACTVMAVELFGRQAGLLGSGFVIYAAVACFISYLLSGHSGIYLSQRIGTPKLHDTDVPLEASLRTIRELQPGLGDLLSRAAGNGDEDNQDLLDKGESTMHKHKVRTREIGQVRIYMTPRDKRQREGIRNKLFGKPLYQEIIDAAKTDGILNANAHHTHYGYSNNGKIQSSVTEIPNPALTLCVELIGERPELETFCRKHGDLLKGKVIVYKHMEHWELTDHALKSTDASVEELDADLAPDEADDRPQ